MPSTGETSAVELIKRIQDRSARSGVIGLGYVGLPLAVELAAAGFHTTGFETSADKADQVNRGESYIADIDPEIFRKAVGEGKLRAKVGAEGLSECEAVSICVPTPLRKTRDPDLSFIVEATEMLAENIKPRALVILESTTYPGTTEEAVLPTLEAGGREVGKDFFLCFSPERVDPGNERFQTKNIPKVIGGVTPACTEVGAAYYGAILEKIVPVSAPVVAEMVKLLENTFRMINIGLANEMALMCDRMGINVWEVIEAASTKPFGFMPFYPGPGLGGHCIPVDPHYLSWKTKQIGYEPRFIGLASEINGLMPEFVVSKIQNALNDAQKPIKGSKIHIVGVAYKPDVDDMRESPALDIVALLSRKGADISYSDPFVPAIDIEGHTWRATSLDQAADADCAVIVTNHRGVDYPWLLKNSSLIVDTRNALKGNDDPKITRL